ncbi:MAG: hypothetical protein NDJ90_09560 [Oligoflexia bacterium]|nr:hypothetical protein [Oligoflexia bacterium]
MKTLKTKQTLTFIFGLSLLSCPALASVLEPRERGSFTLEAEAQLLWQGRNDAAVPGDTGTRFSLKDALSSPAFGIRLEPTYSLSDRHQLRGVFAPLTLEDAGRLSQDVAFQGAAFSPSSPVTAVFKFNSYRLTYRYALVAAPESPDWLVQVGLTAKIRDARIALRQGGLSAEKTNVGFVPLLHFAAAYRLGAGWQAEAELDALAAPQGRAEDVRLGLRKRFDDSGLSATAGYRILEGGADNDTVFTFALFHYAVLGLAYEF